MLASLEAVEAQVAEKQEELRQQRLRSNFLHVPAEEFHPTNNKLAATHAMPSPIKLSNELEYGQVERVDIVYTPQLNRQRSAADIGKPAPVMRGCSKR